MPAVLVICGLLMIGYGALVMAQAPSITQEIASLLLIGFGFMTAAAGVIVHHLEELRRELRDLQPKHRPQPAVKPATVAAEADTPEELGEIDTRWRDALSNRGSQW